MIFRTIPVTAGGETVDLTLYLPDNSNEIDENRRRPTVLIFPGGGYAFRSRREAEPVALKFAAADINAAILEYSVAPARFPTALLQAARAVALLRENAAAGNVDPDRICVLGFSAGGHLAANYGTLWNSALVKDEFGFENGENRPDGMILCYPVITSGTLSHSGSIANLLGDKADDPELRALVSCEKQVNSDTPPAFIWHTFTDDAVPVQNSLMMASALADKGINTELHIFPRGWHGLSLCNETVYGTYNGDFSEVQVWIDMAARWVKQL